jgi:5-formyltetrahydrofolate cyclo-ligase
MSAPSSPPPRPSLRSKPELRAWARATRDAVAPPTRAAAAAAIGRTIDERFVAPLPAGAVIALFAAMGSELDLRDLDARARARGVGVAYPRVVRGERPLRFHLASLAELEVATFGVAEPTVAMPEVPLASIALVVVPGLAFTAAGARLGWGAGHYDATLPTIAGPSLGVTLAGLVVDELPESTHDRRVAHVVTEDGVVTTPATDRGGS